MAAWSDHEYRDDRLEDFAQSVDRDHTEAFYPEWDGPTGLVLLHAVDRVIDVLPERSAA